MFNTLSPISGCSNPQQASAVRPNAWTDLDEPGRGIISISCIVLSDCSLRSPGLGTHSRRRTSTECLDGFREPGASIISISCIFFQMPSPIRIHSRRQLFDRNGTDLESHGASIISISCISFQMPLSDLALEPTAGVSTSTECLDGFNEPRGEHHEHQLDFVSDALSDSNPQQASLFDRMLGRIYRTTGRASSASAAFPLRCPLPSPRLFESTAGVAVRPNAWTDLTNHGASIISISCISFQIPSVSAGVAICWS